MFPLMGVPMGGGGNPINTLAPAIAAAAVIGTEQAGDNGTWVPAADTYTYQRQRYVAGEWVNIVAATDFNYTLVDADFGYALRLEVTATNAAGSTVAYSNATNLVIEAPAQSLGGELMLDGDMELNNTNNWQGYDGGLASKQTATPHGGARNLRATIGAGNNVGGAQQNNILTIGGWFETSGWNRSDGTVVPTLTSLGGPNVFITLPISANWQNYRTFSRAVGDDLVLRGVGGSDANWLEWDDLSTTALTLNAQLIAPSANMRLDFKYTLPVSPIVGSQVWILPRISDFAGGNNWRGVIQYTGAQWNINLYTVAANVATSRVSAVNVGTTNGMRVNMNADSISLYITANGTDWTQIGTTITNDTYKTAVGVNALWTSDVTPGQLIYAAAV
jgi:hypothetical protein